MSKMFYSGKKLMLLLIFCISGLFSFGQKNIVIVTGTDYISHMTFSQLLAIYNGNITEIESGPISFLDHEQKTQIYKDFVKQYFNLTPEQMQQYWEKMKIDKGKRPPKFLPDGLLSKAIPTIKGSISYYYEDAVPAGLRVIKVNR